MYHGLPVGAVVRLRNGETVTIVERPSHWVTNDLYPVIAKNYKDELDSWTEKGEFYFQHTDDNDMVAVVHYGGESIPDPQIVEIDRLIEQLRELGAPTPKTSGALVDPEKRADMIQTLRGLIPPERVKAPIVGMVADALKPAINRIERVDVENFSKERHMQIVAHGAMNLFDRYQEIATRSAIYPGQGTPFGVMYAALGLAEAGEVQNKVKKGFRDDGMIEFVDEPFQNGDVLVRFKPMTPERRAAIIKEMGGALWYMATLAKEIGITLSEVAGNNLDELCSRTERDTLSGDGDDR